MDVEIEFFLKCFLASKWVESYEISRLLLDRFESLENAQSALDIDHGRLMEIEGGILAKPGSNPFDAHRPFLGCQVVGLRKELERIGSDFQQRFFGSVSLLLLVRIEFFGERFDPLLQGDALGWLLDRGR